MNIYMAFFITLNENDIYIKSLTSVDKFVHSLDGKQEVLLISINPFTAYVKKDNLIIKSVEVILDTDGDFEDFVDYLSKKC